MTDTDGPQARGDGDVITVRRQWLEEIAAGLRAATSQVGFGYSRPDGMRSLMRIAEAVQATAVAKVIP